MKKRDYSDFFEKIHIMAKASHWRRYYEKESDTLFWSKRPYPADNRLAQIAREITFYVDKRGNINGLIIQPYLNNFVKHVDTKQDANILKVLAKESGKVSRAEIDKAEITLSDSIKTGIELDLKEQKFSMKDLNNFIVAVAK